MNVETRSGSEDPGSAWFSSLQVLFRQQQKLFQQAKVAQSSKLKNIKELYEHFIKVA